MLPYIEPFHSLDTLKALVMLAWLEGRRGCTAEFCAYGEVHHTPRSPRAPLTPTRVFLSPLPLLFRGTT